MLKCHRSLKGLLLLDTGKLHPFSEVMVLKCLHNDCNKRTYLSICNFIALLRVYKLKSNICKTRTFINDICISTLFLFHADNANVHAAVICGRLHKYLLSVGLFITFASLVFASLLLFLFFGI